jgi:exopolyphosphatase/guanosine-5'-triphosphate,3'-diphosphate pyrophosphatase
VPNIASEAALATRASSASAEAGILAAVDLGSNSFHMVVARLSHGQLTVIDRMREMVRLAAGLDEDNQLDEAVQARALECLARFGERIRAMRADRVRVVGTNTLRKARESEAFLEAAEQLLGHPVEVISGIEEARLIYLGASHSLPLVDGPQLVVDIGGGSTEIVAGHGYQPDDLESLYLGCVSVSEKFFGKQKLSARRFEKARLAGRLELEPVRERFRQVGAVRWVGCSGTIRAAQNVVRAHEGEDAELTVAALERTIKRMIDAGRLDKLSLDGLSDERKPVFAGGIAILVEVMGQLGMDSMQVAEGSLRDGILQDMLGRLTREDARVRTVRAMAARFHVDPLQAERVEATAMHFYHQLAETWQLDDEEDGANLRWAARLHEIGLDIAHAQYHRHGAYLLEFSDMPGFPTLEQRVLALLVGSHRRSFSRKIFQALPKSRQANAIRLAVLLRLAVLFHRSRTNVDYAGVLLEAKKASLQVTIPEGSPADNPLILADLEQERRHLANAGVELELVTPEID